MDRVRYYTLGFIPSKLKPVFTNIGGKIMRDSEGYMDVQFTSDYFTIEVMDDSVIIFNLQNKINIQPTKNKK